MQSQAELAVLGTGNIGRAMALGLEASGRYAPGQMILTRRKLELLGDLEARGFRVQSDNRDAVRRATTVVVAVAPQQLDALLAEIGPDLDPSHHLVVSIVSGASIAAISARVGKPIDIVRAMPNTAIALGQSMTCVALADPRADVRERVLALFDAVGQAIVIDEELMIPATALCACGIAFFLRAVRAASQGGIEIGFHPHDALRMAAQTALGAASLILEREHHPEREIDLVTTPRGCTIAGLNEMEHQGFSSALIKGITTSAIKAASLYSEE